MAKKKVTKVTKKKVAKVTMAKKKVTRADALKALATWCTADEEDYRDLMGTPTRWHALLAELGPLGACQWVLRPRPEAWWLKTLTPLYEAACLGWSVERFAAYEPAGAVLFTKAEIATARTRLEALGYRE
jgi:hypothetical protein